MSTKDKRIWSPDGGKYPFKASDEYFDNLTARIMEQVDALDKESAAPVIETKVVDMGQVRRNRWIRTISIAASFALIAVVALKFIPTTTSNTETENYAAEYTVDDYNEQLMSYAMADNMAVYDYLSGSAEE